MVSGGLAAASAAVGLAPGIEQMQLRAVGRETDPVATADLLVALDLGAGCARRPGDRVTGRRPGKRMAMSLPAMCAPKSDTATPVSNPLAAPEIPSPGLFLRPRGPQARQTMADFNHIRSARFTPSVIARENGPVRRHGRRGKRISG